MATDIAGDPFLLLPKEATAFDDNNGSSFPTLAPSSIIGTVHMWVIIGVTLVMAVVFLAAYLQLSLVLCYGYKLISYQTIFLFNILLWACFRLVFNSFYFYYCCELISKISPTSKWFLTCFPEVLLFLSLALLVHYFIEHLIKVLKRSQETSYLDPSYKQLSWYRGISSLLWAIVILTFISVNIVLSYLIFLRRVSWTWRIVRVAVLETLILVMGVILGVCMLLIYATRAGKDTMDAKRVSKWQAIIISALLIMLFSSRAIYNIIAVSLQYHGKASSDSIKFATDLADFNMSEEGDIYFFCVLLIWEVIPICLMVVFFRIRSSVNPFKRHDDGSSSLFSSEISRHFFHGPNRFRRKTAPDTSVNSSYHKSSHVSIPSLPGQLGGQPFSKAGYGSTSRTHSSVPASNGYKTPSFMPGTTPPRLFTGSPSVFSDTQASSASASNSGGNNGGNNRNVIGFTINE